MGWFFGFKLHLIINDKGEILNFVFTTGGVDDREPLKEGTLLKNIRSFNNFIANALGAIAAYCFFDKKPAIDVEFVNDGQLSLF